MTAGFHSIGADRELMSQIGLGYEMKPWKGVIRLLCGESRGRDLNESGTCQLGWHSDRLLKSSSSCHH